MPSIELQKFIVCTECHAVGTALSDCTCTYDSDHPVIELEFEICTCCDSLVSDGFPADTKFNVEQLKKKKLSK